MSLEAGIRTEGELFDPCSVNQYALLTGDSATILKTFAPKSVHCIVTSPPYWGQREYSTKNSIGLESDFETYVANLIRIFRAAREVLADNGSLWLNMGDRYVDKDLVGMPWRIALALKDDGWILRQDVIWDKKTLTQSAKDRLRTLHEYVFHLVKRPKYYYDRKAILERHDEGPKVTGNKVVSITGVTGYKYRNNVMASDLTEPEKRAALDAIDQAMTDMRAGKIVDFRMQIRGIHRVLNGDVARLSGRARELSERGFFIKTQKAEGHLPGNIWRMVPENAHRTDSHCAVYPVGLMELPIKSTCPPGGVVLDPFAGTGTSIISALKHGRRGVGIDISAEYVARARNRIERYIQHGLER